MSNTRRVKIQDLLFDRQNANKGTPRGQYMLDTSIDQYGAGRSILIDKDGEIIAGNKTLQAWADAGYDDVLVIETDGKTLVAVQRGDMDLDDPSTKARELAYADNRASEVSLAWDADQILADMQAGIDLSGMFLEDELNELFNIPTLSTDTDILADLLTRSEVPDAIWASDNDWGIPLLDSHLQADALDTPVLVWGSISRHSTNKGTWLFYTEDNRFNALWTDPSPIVNSKCVNIVEPNFSCYGDMPLAIGLYQIYRKRWLARYWQSRGIRVFVDMNVNEKFYELNLLGVPNGWSAYATRGYSDKLHLTEQEFDLAQARAGDKTILFLVYGGGDAVKQHCQKRGWLWIPETMDVAKGKEAVYG